MKCSVMLLEEQQPPTVLSCVIMCEGLIEA